MINAYCGYNCENCPIFKETKNNNLDEIRRLLFNNNPDDNIDTLGCKGCLEKNNKNYMCKQCLIRQCAMDKKIISCGICDNFPCDKLAYVSKQTMEQLKKINEEVKKNEKNN